jgi:GT2 family glycosyltransferase
LAKVPQKTLAKFEQQTLPFKIYQIVSPHNLGYAAGVNAALRWLGKNHPHPYYLLINNDSQATSEMLQHIIHFVQWKNDLVMVAPVIDDGQNK